MRFLPTFKYRLRDCMWSMLVIVIVMIALTLLTQFGVMTFGAYTTTEDGYTETTSTMNFTMPYVIFMLVLGIVTVREDMRIGIQNGASRRTSFLANISCVAVTSLCLSLTTIVFYTVWNTLDTGVVLIDFYSMMYLGNFSPSTVETMLMSAVMTFVFSMAFAAIGCFMSLMYWRLNKIGKWVVSIGMGAAVILLINAGAAFYSVGEIVARFARFIVETPWNMNGFFVVLAVVFYIFSMLLVRRNNITAAV